MNTLHSYPPVLSCSFFYVHCQFLFITHYFLSLFHYILELFVGGYFIHIPLHFFKKQIRLIWCIIYFRPFLLLHLSNVDEKKHGVDEWQYELTIKYSKEVVKKHAENATWNANASWRFEQSERRCVARRVYSSRRSSWPNTKQLFWKV